MAKKWLMLATIGMMVWPGIAAAAPKEMRAPADAPPQMIAMIDAELASCSAQGWESPQVVTEKKVIIWDEAARRPQGEVPPSASSVNCYSVIAGYRGK